MFCKFQAIYPGHISSSMCRDCFKATIVFSTSSVKAESSSSLLDSFFCLFVFILSIVVWYYMLYRQLHHDFQRCTPFTFIIKYWLYHQYNIVLNNIIPIAYFIPSSLYFLILYLYITPPLSPPIISSLTVYLWVSFFFF